MSTYLNVLSFSDNSPDKLNNFYKLLQSRNINFRVLENDIDAVVVTFLTNKANDSSWVTENRNKVGSLLYSYVNYDLLILGDIYCENGIIKSSFEDKFATTTETELLDMLNDLWNKHYR